MSHDDGLPPLREVIARHNLQASKALGQNFLFDEQLLDRIAAVPGSLAGETVFEVGPGPGGLTRALLRAGAIVTAVERDDRCRPALEELKEPYPDSLSIISGDAMKISAAEIFDTPIHIIANLPYNVGTALLVNWLTEQVWPPYWKSLTLMFQREVADRIVAKPGGPAYGRLSVLSQWRSAASISMNVHRSAFTPPPKVMSAVVHITPNPSDGVVSPKTMGHLTAAAFGQRRKMLRQSLKSIPKAVAGLEELGIDPKRRAETVSVEEFTALARLISA